MAIVFNARLASIVINTRQPDGSYSSQTVTYGYQAHTNLINTVTSGSITTSYAYEPQTGRLSTINSNAGDAQLYAASYGYTTSDQRQTESVTQQNPDGVTTDSHNWTFGYDDTQQLTSVTDTTSHASLYTYAYDGAGNRSDTTFTSTYGVANGLNQYANLHYNARGDLTDDGVYIYAWNALDQLVSETPKTPTDGSQKIEIIYDAQSRRTERDIYNWNAAAGEWDGEANTVLKYVYQGSQLVAELDGSNHILLTLTYGPNSALVAVTDFTASTPKTYTVLTDANGNTMALVDPASGTVPASYQYGPNGQLLSAAGPESAVCPILWGGMAYDGNALPYYAWHRYYSPGQGRFISRDPIAEGGGLDVDAYCGNDPVNNIDSTGLTQSLVLRKDERRCSMNMIRIAFGKNTEHSCPTRYDLLTWPDDILTHKTVKSPPAFVSTRAAALAVRTRVVERSTKATFKLSDTINQNRDDAMFGMRGTWAETGSDTFCWVGVICIYAAGAIKAAPVAIRAANGVSGQTFRVVYTYTSSQGRAYATGALATCFIASMADDKNREAFMQSSGDPLGEFNAMFGSLSSSVLELRMASREGAASLSAVNLSLFDATGPAGSHSVIPTGAAQNTGASGIFRQMRNALPVYNGTTSGILLTNEGKLSIFSSRAPSPAISNYFASGHVEGQAAQFIEASGSSGGVLFHNNPQGTCGFCEGQVPTLLPENANLLVCPPVNAVAPGRGWYDQPRMITGNSSSPKLKP